MRAYLAEKETRSRHGERHAVVGRKEEPDGGTANQAQKGTDSSFMFVTPSAHQRLRQIPVRSQQKGCGAQCIVPMMPTHGRSTLCCIVQAGYARPGYWSKAASDCTREDPEARPI